MVILTHLIFTNSTADIDVTTGVDLRFAQDSTERLRIILMVYCSKYPA